MEQQFYQKLEDALRAIDVDPERVEKLKPDTHVLTVIRPSKFLSLLQNMGVRVKDYVGEAVSLRFEGFSEIQLSQEGAEKIREIGRKHGDMQRANQLVNLGLENMRHLYSELRLSDLITMSFYESLGRAA